MFTGDTTTTWLQRTCAVRVWTEHSRRPSGALDRSEPGSEYEGAAVGDGTPLDV